jgi:hypothetical protein
MYVDMQMRDFLEGGLPDRVPKANAVVWKGSAYCTRNLSDGLHECRAGLLVQIPNVVDMRFWDDENMPRIGLAEINEGKGCSVLKHNAGLSRPIDDAAENAMVSHIPSMQT